MKFLLISIDRIHNGFALTNYLVAQCNALSRAGNNVEFLSLSAPHSSIAPSGTFGAFKYQYLLHTTIKSTWGRNILVGCKFLQLLPKIISQKYDVINLTFLPIPLIMMLYLVRLCSKTKLIQTRLENSPVGRLRKFCYRYCINGFITGSKLQQSFYQRFTNNEKQSFILPNCINSEFFQIEKNEFTLQDKTFLYCGLTGHTRDGLELIVDGFRQFYRKHKNSEYTLTLVGNIELYPKKKELIKFIEENQLSEKVIFLGVVAAEQLCGLYRKASALILALPEIPTGGIPYKLSEYMYSGTAVITTLVPPIDEFLCGKDECIKIIPNSSDSIAQAFEFVINNSQDTLLIGQKGRKIAQKWFNPDNYMDSFEKFISNIK